MRIVESGIVGTDHVRLIVSGDDGARFTNRAPIFALIEAEVAKYDHADLAALRQLGLAVGFRLWDTETSEGFMVLAVE